MRYSPFGAVLDKTISFPGFYNSMSTLLPRPNNSWSPNASLEIQAVMSARRLRAFERLGRYNIVSAGSAAVQSADRSLDLFGNDEVWPSR